jgi:hypothetical protein
MNIKANDAFEIARNSALVKMFFEFSTLVFTQRLTRINPCT